MRYPWRPGALHSAAPAARSGERASVTSGVGYAVGAPSATALDKTPRPCRHDAAQLGRRPRGRDPPPRPPHHQSHHRHRCRPRRIRQHIDPAVRNRHASPRPRSSPVSAPFRGFRSAAAFASYTALPHWKRLAATSSPIAPRAPGIASSTAAHHGDHPNRPRHPGRRLHQNRSAGKSHREALRCLKRRLSDVVYRQLVHNAAPPMGAGPGGGCGGGFIVQRGRLTHLAPALRTSHSPGQPTATIQPTTRT